MTAPQSAAAPVVLVVQHEDGCPPGHVGAGLLAAGCRLDVRRPYAGDPLPADLDAVDALLVLGGEMNADEHDRHPWLAPTKELVRAAARDGVPTLGICLGHQIVAGALGGRVVRNPAGPQEGLVPTGWTPDAGADPLLGPCTAAPTAVHFNGDIVDRLPKGAVVLARAPGGEVQAARHADSVWGVQCHPEAGAEIVGRWPGTEGSLAAIAAAEPGLVATWAPLARALAALARHRRDHRP